MVQRKVENAEIGSDVESGIDAMKGGGQPLTRSAREFFEPRFGYDFSGVRVHSDAKASDLAHGVNAKAFTIGRDVVFGAGQQYKPESAEGKSLLAHELVHTIQQTSTGDARTHLQRTIGDGHDLTSPRFAGDERLEACYDDEARLTKGAQGESVRKVQQALIDLGYDLGPTGADGIYGDLTWNAVKQFKSDQVLGWEWMGDVGPGTMGRPDELCAPAVPPTQKPPVSAPQFSATGIPLTRPPITVFTDGRNIDTHAHFRQFEWYSDVTMSGLTSDCFEVGYLQTLTNVKIQATYFSDGAPSSPSTCSFVVPRLPIRDSKEETPIWTDAKKVALLGTCELVPMGTPLPPGISPIFQASKTGTRASDDPGGPFEIRHPNASKKLIRRIEESFRFITWLAIRPRRLPGNNVRSYQFLKHCAWKVERIIAFTHTPSGSVGFNYVTNETSVESFDDGQGNTAPELGTPIANKASSKVCPTETPSPEPPVITKSPRTEWPCLNDPDPSYPPRCDFTHQEESQVYFSLFEARTRASLAYMNLAHKDPYDLEFSKRTVGEDITFDILDKKVSVILEKLRSLRLNENLIRGTCDEPQCRIKHPRGTYGVAAAATLEPELTTVAICPFSFTLPKGQLALSLLHEAGHMDRIDPSLNNDERYCSDEAEPVNCHDACPNRPKGESWLKNVDAWARLICCLSFRS